MRPFIHPNYHLDWDSWSLRIEMLQDNLSQRLGLRCCKWMPWGQVYVIVESLNVGIFVLFGWCLHLTVPPLPSLISCLQSSCEKQYTPFLMTLYFLFLLTVCEDSSLSEDSSDQDETLHCFWPTYASLLPPNPA